MAGGGGGGCLVAVDLLVFIKMLIFQQQILVVLQNNHWHATFGYWTHSIVGIEKKHRSLQIRFKVMDYTCTERKCKHVPCVLPETGDE